MNKIEELLQLFNIDEKKIDYDLLLLSLTHKTKINNQQNRDNFQLLDYYYDVGLTVYSILLKQFIYEKVSKDRTIITKSYDSSKQIFIEEFISKTQIHNFFLVSGEDLLNRSVIQNLTYQFIGLLFVEGHFLNLEKFFQTIFDSNKLQLFDDYYIIVQTYAHVRKVSINVKELEVTGADHERKFRYELLCSGKSVIAEGRSKKDAKRNCAKLFCEQYINQEEMMIYSGFKQQKRGRKKYNPSSKAKVTLHNLANKIGLTYDEVLICFTHVSLTNEFDVTNNSAVITIGADIEKLYLLVTLYYKYRNKPSVSLFEIVSYVQGQQEVYRNFIEKENLSPAIMGSNSLFSTEKSILKANEDSFKAILYFLFYKKKSISPIQKIGDVYEEFLKKTDLRFIAPSNTLQEKFQELNIGIIYTDLKQDVGFSCVTTIEIPSFSLQFYGVGQSKKEARQSAGEKALHWFFEKIEPFFLGTKENDLDFPFLEKLLYHLIRSKEQEFRQVIFNNNFFGMNDARNGYTFGFIEKIVNTFKITLKFRQSIHQGFVSLISKAPQILLMCLDGTDFLIEAVITDMAEFIQKGNSNATYLLERNFDNISLQSNVLREKYISEDGLRIKYIINPSPKLQMIAVKNNPNAVYYIPTPSSEVINYLLKNVTIPKNLESIIFSSSKNNPELLVDLTYQEYESYLKEIDSQKSRFKILSNRVSFDFHLRALFKLTKIKKFYVAAGFVYSSGIELIKSELEQLLSNDGQIKFIAGNLQNYYSSMNITKMDLKTAESLNEFIRKGASVKTFNEQFYHGKVYYLESDSLKIVLIGSTNFSRQAFRKNREINCIYFFNKEEHNDYTELFEQLWTEAESLPLLDISKFTGTFDLAENQVQEELNSISIQNMEKRINTVPDEALRKRLTLWLEYKPSNIFDNILVANQDYIAIEYVHRNMVVLESFYHGNSYFVFYDIPMNELLQLIINKTKSEIFALSGMDKRGYHVRELLKLELNIKSYFLGR